MTGTPLVSVVIPHFNRSELLAETLKSIEEQEYRNWEAIVVDDGSDEFHWSAIQAMETDRLRILRRKDGLKGPSRCRNLGAAAAQGEYLIFVDSDDLLAPWCLSDRVSVADHSHDCSMWVFPVLLFKERPGDLDICWNHLEGNDDLMRFLRSDPPWHTSSPIWQKAAFEALGGFNERMIYGDDADLHTKALIGGVQYKKYPASLPDAFVRRHGQSRITQGWAPSLIESRQVRLQEGTRLLARENAKKEWVDTWKGQYFVECEELLFSVSGSKATIRKTLDAWTRRHRPSAWRRAIARTYFGIGALCMNRAYWVVRLTRRMAILTLPSDYFPEGGTFHKWRLPSEQFEKVRNKLKRKGKDAKESADSERLPKYRCY